MLRIIQRDITISSTILLGLLCLTTLADGKRKPSDEPPFEYVAGTENLARGCSGKLEILRDAMAFSCTAGTVSVPFSAVTLMQYRPNLSKQVMRMNISWKVEPQISKARDNQFLAIIYSEQGAVHALVLKVDPSTMRPYLAEIELKSGKSVQVYRSYDEF